MFSIDTSGFLDAWARNYPPDIFQSLWAQMDKAATTGILKASEEVIEELERKDDGASNWINAHPEMIIRTDETVQEEVAKILEAHPRLVNAGKNRSGGDPFVIAVARIHGYSVITGESASRKLDNPRIPDVCGALGVPCLNILEFIRLRDWKI